MIYLIIAILLFSLNNVLWKKNLASISISALMTYRSLLTSLLAIGLLFYFYDLNTFTGVQFLKISIASLLGAIGLVCMLTVFKKTSMQWVAIYNLLGVGFTILYLWIFKELEIKSSILGISLITLGFIFYVGTHKNSTLKISLKQHLILLLMVVCFGTGSIINWENLHDEIPPILIIANQESIVFISGIILLSPQKKTSSLLPTLQKYFKRVLLMSFVIFLALLFSFLGLKITNPIISGTLFLASPLTTILFSALFFKEKISLKEWAAIATIALGAFLLHIQTQ
ncbi:DMT family transporter [Polaribacter sp. HL-MS24]|uniref:DMT family transporter n=1 Tax=Polaribacter sp. HL-MS24 TaxID=3077735 RepID=UPI002934A37F|nr:DMT family transporter [Polaribacter sp. HL-MS24]WOC39689.1 DMT family transporter [Polaribacter sp. HL-MS24]